MKLGRYQALAQHGHACQQQTCDLLVLMVG